MNLSKLFELQATLDTHIEHVHPGVEDKLEKKILALLVELGELANEWRGFKYWSNDQEPRTESKVVCHACGGKGHFLLDLYSKKKESCGYCGGTGLQEDKNPLLEEYVDCLHFILSIGNEINVSDSFADKVNFNIGGRTIHTKPIKNFIEVNKSVMKLLVYEKSFAYHNLIDNFMTLGDSLGFTEEQIEQAYIKKNEINHQRQLSGY